MKHFRILVFAACSICVAAASARGQTAPAPPVVKPGEERSAPAPKSSGGANLGSAQMYAYVNADGTVDQAHSKGTAACAETDGTCRYGVGAYIVRFARNISHCGVTATIGQKSALYLSQNSTITAATSVQPEHANAVIVVITSGVNPADRSFNVVVMC